MTAHRLSFYSFSSLLFLYLLTPELSFAHSSTEGYSGGIMGGFMHPLSGLDHITAMVAVGLLGAFLGKKARWALPIIFPMVMVVGGGMGIAGIYIPYIEIGIALSSVVIGGMVALFPRNISVIVAGIVVAFFAIFHGYAHGTEMYDNVNAAAYALGFVVSTGLLHLLGIVLGCAEKIPYGEYIVRFLGGLIALAGVGFLMGWL